MDRLAYLLTSLLRHLQPGFNHCPSCGAHHYQPVQRKYLATTLRRCGDCRLLYRHPIDRPRDTHRFYQRAYREGFTTELPDPRRLERLMTDGFAGTEKDYRSILELLGCLAPAPAKLFDFGCSWGYGSWQLARAGYAVTAFEISEPRRAFAAQRLGVAVDDTFPLDAIDEPFDLFFSSHVLEHVPSPAAAIAAAERYLRPGGLFIAFTPNGSTPFRAADEAAWTTSWGRVHPNLLDDEYYRTIFHDRPYFISSSPFDHQALRRWAAADAPGQVTGNLDGGELLVVARRP